jgi:chaperonin GroES
MEKTFEDFSRRAPMAGFGSEMLAPRIDIAESKDAINVTAELPGVEEKDVDVTLADGVLTIRGEKKSERDEQDKDKSWHVVERSYGSKRSRLKNPKRYALNFHLNSRPIAREASFVPLVVPSPSATLSRRCHSGSTKILRDLLFRDWRCLMFGLAKNRPFCPPFKIKTTELLRRIAMKFRPLHDRVVIKRIEAEERTIGGIIIPDTAKEKPQEGEVIAVGPGGRDESGKLIPIDVKVGDRVLFGKWSGTEVKLDGVEYIIMKESDLMGVLMEAGAYKKAA